MYAPNRTRSPLDPALHRSPPRPGALLVLAGALGLAPGRAPATAADSSTAAPRQATPAQSACSVYGPARLVTRVTHPQLVESSGIVASRRHAGVFYTHNDSGNLPLLFAVREDGTVPAVFRLQGAKNEDWEDISLGPAPSGDGSALYLGDVGSSRPEPARLTIYVLPEPELPAAPPAEPIVVPAARFHLTYPEDPQDCEALAVHPVTGVLYLMTKPLSARPPLLYRCAPPFAAGATRALEPVGPVSLANDPLVTGMDIHPGGARLIVRTYFRAYEFVAATPVLFEERIAFPARPVSIVPMGQSEAICYGAGGTSLFVTAEGSPMPLYEVPCAALTQRERRKLR